MTDENIIELAINTIRTLSIDALHQAKSGHSGTPMARAPLVYTIWNRVMRFDLRMGALRWQIRPDNRNENLRSLGSAERASEKVWF